MKLGAQPRNGSRPAEARAFYEEERMFIRESRRGHPSLLPAPWRWGWEGGIASMPY